MKDDDDGRTDAVPAGTVIAAGGFYVFADPDMSYGLGKADAARLYLGDGTTLIDSYSWTAHASTTYGRCPDGVGAFTTTTLSTRGAANACGSSSPEPTPTPTPTTSVPAAGSLVINEVESNGDDTDWFELFNTTDSALDVTGYVVRDNDDGHSYVLPAGSVVPAHGILLVDQLTSHDPGFDFGLGGEDQVRVFAPDGVTLVAEASWSVHATTTYGLCPDGVGELRGTTRSTKGTANDCSAPVAINEVESSGGTPGDWIELVNLSGTAVSAGGLVVTDSDVDEHRYTIPAGTEIPANGYLVLEEADFDFGLGGDDAVHLFDTDGVTEIDATTWSAHAATTWARCPDATGAFGVSASSTKGTANVCAGEVTVEAWPGGADVRVLDDEDTFGGDLSGLDVADGVLWGVQNGDGLLYKMDAVDGSVAAGWEDGRRLRYADGTGTVDAEGVTVLGDAVYVSSERDNDAGSVSRPAVLRYDPSQSGDELRATAEWNLAADFPGLGANAGLEGVTWISDSWLVSQGFVDERTSAAYDPADYAGHGDGLFFVGVEGTAKVYAYALSDDGTFARIATIDTPFAVVADVQFDRDVLWVVCDEACDGRTATYEIDADGAFAATHVYARPANAANVANEGFAIGEQCVDGVVQTFYADDADTDGFSLRSGTLTCTDESEPEPEPSATPTPEPTASPEPTGTPEPTASPEPTGTPTTEPTATPEPTTEPTGEPTVSPEPTDEPTAEPTAEPTDEPTVEPTEDPTAAPTTDPTDEPTAEPTATTAPSVTPEPTDDASSAPEPTATSAPTASGMPQAPQESDLTEETRGGLTSPASVVAGANVTVTLTGVVPGAVVQGWMFSTPTNLGTAEVSSAGAATFTVPADMPTGSHRIVVTDENGTILGWAPITVTSAAGALAVTGGDAMGTSILAVLAVIVLAVGIIAVRRTRRV